MRRKVIDRWREIEKILRCHRKTLLAVRFSTIIVGFFSLPCLFSIWRQLYFYASRQLLIIFGLFWCSLLSSHSFAAEAKCSRINRTAQDEPTKKVESFLQKLEPAMSDQKELAKLFHPRLKMSEQTLEKSFSKIQRHVGTEKTSEVSFHIIDVFALTNIDSPKKPLLCENDKDQNLEIFPMYGYSDQYSVWLQAAGGRELTRVHVMLVQDQKKEFKIGTFQIFPWTYGGEDFSGLVKLGQVELSEQKNKNTAYAYFDAASKLIKSIGVVEFGAYPEIKKLMSDLMTDEQWLKNIQQQLKDSEIIYAATLYTKDGLGLVVKKRTKVEISFDQIRKECEEKAKTLKDSGWFRPKSGLFMGLRCNYLIPQEQLTSDGKLGGIFVPF